MPMPATARSETFHTTFPPATGTASGVGLITTASSSALGAVGLFAQAVERTTPSRIQMERTRMWTSLVSQIRCRQSSVYQRPKLRRTVRLNVVAQIVVTGPERHALVRRTGPDTERHSLRRRALRELLRQAIACEV